MRRHLEGALDELVRTTPEGLDAGQTARRREAIAELARYIAAERYPVNRVAPHPTPIFVDEAGARCAVAALLDATGRHDLVREISARRNLAYVRELADEPELIGWLEHHGLTVAEAARIQPAYPQGEEIEWRPTVAVITSAQFGANTDSGAELAVAAGARVGVRRSGVYSHSSGLVEHGSLALMAEYFRTAVIGSGGAHQIGLLLHWEPRLSNRDAQWFLLTGPLLSLDNDHEPGEGVGAQIGGGFSLRRRAFPLLVEGIGRMMTTADGISLRLGVNLGTVW